MAPEFEQPQTPQPGNETPPPQPAEHDQGYPENTPVAEMTLEQQVAYWRSHSRKHEQRSRERSDYDELKKKAAAFDKAQEDSASEMEKAVAKARKEGRAEAVAEANAAGVRAMLKAALAARGMKKDDISDVIDTTNLNSFIRDDEIDDDRLVAHVNRLAGTAFDENPDMGQGKRNTPPRTSAREAARADLKAQGKLKT